MRLLVTVVFILLDHQSLVYVMNAQERRRAFDLRYESREKLKKKKNEGMDAMHRVARALLISIP